MMFAFVKPWRVTRVRSAAAAASVLKRPKTTSNWLTNSRRPQSDGFFALEDVPVPGTAAAASAAAPTTTATSRTILTVEVVPEGSYGGLVLYRILKNALARLSS